jgi:hypothetical protein
LLRDALDLNPHSDSLVLDEAYVVRHGRFEGFVQLEAPSDEDVAGITGGDPGDAELRPGKVEDDELAAVEDGGSVLLPCMAASVQRVGVMGEGERRVLRRPGRRRYVEMVDKRRCADVDGFSFHADVCVPARDRAQLERLCRYVARPAAPRRWSSTRSTSWASSRRWLRDHARTWSAITDAWHPTRACAPR